MTTPVEKHYINAQELLEASFELGARVLESGFRPNFIVGIWRGGTPVGIAVQELLAYFGLQTDHIAIRTSLYKGIDEQHSEIRVHGLQYLVDTVDADDGLLIVDDVFDTGRSIDAVIRELETRARRNTPGDIRIATAWHKPARNRTGRAPDYHVHATDRWIVFPHELCGLTPAEIRENKRPVAGFVERLRQGSTMSPLEPPGDTVSAG
jgi:hypoxanthine phosphoribosyltransferase